MLLTAALLPLNCYAADQAAESLLVGFHSECPGGAVSDGPEGLEGIALALGKVAMGGVVDWVGAMASAQGEDKESGIGEGVGHGQFYRINENGTIGRNFGCIWMLRPARPDAGSDDSADAAKVLARLRNMLGDSYGPITDAPDFYAEFDIDTLPHRKDVFALRVLSVYLGRSGISSWSSRERGLTTGVSLYYPNDPKQPFASTAFNFSDLPVGKFVTRENNGLFRMSSGWMSVPSLENGDKTYVNEAGALLAWPKTHPPEEQPTRLAVKAIGLVNVKASVKETQRGSTFWRAVGSAYNSQKSDLKTALGNQLIPSERREQAILSANAADDLYVKYVGAKLEVDEAQAKLSGLDPKASDIEKNRVQTAVIKAQIAANQAARSAGITLPYPSVYQ
jgi:hypothetical protein